MFIGVGKGLIGYRWVYLVFFNTLWVWFPLWVLYEAFASLWDWGHFRPIDGTQAHPANAFMGLRLKIAPGTASRSAPG